MSAVAAPGPPDPVVTVRLDGVTYRLPFLSLFRLHTTAERSRLEDSIRVRGVRVRVMTYDSPRWGRRCVIDGATRLQIVAALVAAGTRVTCPVTHLGQMSDAVARELAISLNADRRHLTVEEQQAARQERIPRVVEARAEGLSLREIAEREGVSVTQVQRDLADAQPETPADTSGVPGGTPEPASEQSPVPARPVKAVLKSARSALASLSAALCELADGPIADAYRELMDNYQGAACLDALDNLLTDLVNESK